MFPVSIEPFSCLFPFYTKAGVIGVRSLLKREHTPLSNTTYSFLAVPQDNKYHTESPYEERYSQALSVREAPWVWADNVLATTNILGPLVPMEMRHNSRDNCFPSRGGAILGEEPILTAKALTDRA